MANLILGYDDWSEDQTITASAAESTAPASNLKLQQPTDMWVSKTLSGVTLDLDRGVGNTRALNTVALFWTNLTASATWSIQIGTGAPGSTEILSTGSLNFWTSTSLARATWYRIHGVFFQAGMAAARSIRITLNDAGNADGELRAGRLMVGNWWQPTINAQYGSQPFGVIDLSPRELTVGGQTLVRRLEPVPVAGLSLLGTSEAEIRGNLVELQRIRAGAKDVGMVFDPVEDGYRHQKVFHGLLGSQQELIEPNFSLFRADVEIQSLI